MPVDPSLAALDEIEVPERDTPETPVETQAPVEDTPTSPESLIDWEKRYNDLRSFSDRRANEAQQELQTYEEQLAAIEAQQPPRPYSEEYDYDEEDDPLVDHVQKLEARQRATEQQLRERIEADTHEQQLEEEYTYIDSELKAIEEATKDELSEVEANWIGNYAGANRDEHGRPDVRLAYHTYTKLLEDRKQKWVSSKPSGGRPAAGPGAVEVPDLDDPEQREEYLDRAFRGE